MSEVLLESVLVCPACGFGKGDMMPPANFFTNALAARRCLAVLLWRGSAILIFFLAGLEKLLKLNSKLWV
jgi:hypothetical protein